MGSLDGPVDFMHDKLHLDVRPFTRLLAQTLSDVPGPVEIWMRWWMGVSLEADPPVTL
jgi:hypothetical protein